MLHKLRPAHLYKMLVSVDDEDRWVVLLGSDDLFGRWRLRIKSERRRCFNECIHWKKGVI